MSSPRSPSDAASPLLEIHGLQVHYGDHLAVGGIDLEVRRGELLAVVGPSGCGKTSLLRAIAGFEVPSRGRVVIDGEEVASATRWVPPERRRVGMVFQQGALFPHLTVEGNVLYGLRGRRGRSEKVVSALRLVGMERYAHRYPDELSGGEQQRVALARALAPEPRLVLLDEPFASLDAALRRQVCDEVCEILHRAGATALMVTHDQEEALSVGDRVAVLAGGRLLQIGAPEEVYRHPASLGVARFFGEGQTVPCRIEGGYASSFLGRTPCREADGPGVLWVRPEDLRIQPAGGPGTDGRLVRRSYFGHDLLEEVELEGGKTLKVRVLAGDRLDLGQPVTVGLRTKEYPVFPTAEADETLAPSA